MPKTLPENATPASRKLYDLAVRLANACPPAFASEIALVGSASMGLSDDQSDLDINFWADTIPPEAERVAWLQSLGATNVNIGATRADQSYPLAGVLDGVDVGCSWQTHEALAGYVTMITQGALEAGEAQLSTLVDVLVQAVPVRSTGKIEAIQAQLETYPEALRQPLILQKVSAIQAQFKQMPKHLRYGNDLDVNLQASLIGTRVIALLYPINRRWSPQPKWEYRLAYTLPLQPHDLYDRLHQITHDPDIRQRAIHAARLVLDTLEPIADEYDVYEAMSTIETFIKQYA